MSCYAERKKKRYKIFKIFLTIIILLSLFLIHYHFVSLPLIKSVSESKINKIVHEIVNNSANSILGQYDYGDFVYIEKNVDGEIEMIKIDTIRVNLLMQMLCFDVQKQISGSFNSIILQLGLFSGIAYFSEIGPEISIKVNINEIIHGELKSEFESVGINKTRHALYIYLHVNNDLILPMSKYTVKNAVRILICENIFIGDIPENYMEFNG